MSFCSRNRRDVPDQGQGPPSGLRTRFSTTHFPQTLQVRHTAYSSRVLPLLFLIMLKTIPKAQHAFHRDLAADFFFLVKTWALHVGCKISENHSKPRNVLFLFEKAHSSTEHSGLLQRSREIKGNPTYDDTATGEAMVVTLRRTSWVLAA